MSRRRKQPKAPSGSIIRTALDTRWKTPEWILERARVYYRGPIPFDPATAPDNPTKALRFCAGAPGTLFECQTGQNGLNAPWLPPEGYPPGVWLNPPYGVEQRLWQAKLMEQLGLGVRDVNLLVGCSRYEETEPEGSSFQDVLARSNAVAFLVDPDNPHGGKVGFISPETGERAWRPPYASQVLGLEVDLERFHEAWSPVALVRAWCSVEQMTDLLGGFKISDSPWWPKQNGGGA